MNSLPNLIYLNIRCLVRYLEKSKIMQKIISPSRYLRDVIWFSQRTRVSYKWLAQYFDPDALGSHNQNPFLLDFIKPIPIIGKMLPGLWNTNPSVTIAGSEIKIFLRATSFVFNPITNSRGHNSLTSTHPETKLQEDKNHSVVRNALLTGILTKSGRLIREEILIPECPPPTFEDVRPFKYLNREYLIGTWTTQVEVDGKFVINQSIAIYSLDEKEFHFLESPFNFTMEKNWVPIEVLGDNLFVFYSSQPARVLEINLISFIVKITSIESHESGLNLHGRSQFVKMPNGNFLRVASARLPVRDFGLIHFSFLVEHAPNREEIRISRPFFFQTPGFEICNGLHFLSENELIFTWGCNDRASYFANVAFDSLYSWFCVNELEIRNPRSESWKLLRATFKQLGTIHKCVCNQS